MTHNSNIRCRAGQATSETHSPASHSRAHPCRLQTLDQWLIWRYFYKPDLGYWDKPPLDANKSGNAAKSTDPKTWATFDKA